MAVPERYVFSSALLHGKVVKGAITRVALRRRHELALCPRCRKPVHGSDLLISGRCPHCEKALTSLLTPAPRAGLDSSAYLALMGALGVLVGLAMATTAENAP